MCQGGRWFLSMDGEESGRWLSTRGFKEGGASSPSLFNVLSEVMFHIPSLQNLLVLEFVLALLSEIVLEDLRTFSHLVECSRRISPERIFSPPSSTKMPK